MSIYVAAFALSYLIGSFPTAYFVVKRNTQKDIRSLGSGNVGGMNAYEVTGNKFVGILVVGIDALKGIVVVLAVKLLISSAVDVVIVGMTAGIIGHCYPVWLKFHGGRGLAIGAGMLLVTAWIFVAVWLV
ncbi:MAG: glycerol-3-phosphate acyltransferase, partial [Bacteroidota bacterium]|nr:glycerol-3-phosphate acyltransferase [Bacteroidota bacterium]